MDDSSVLADEDLIEPAEIHQAAGMLTVQLGVSIIGALARLRGHAAAVHQPLIDVSREVIGGRLHLSTPPLDDGRGPDAPLGATNGA